jgi:hypothetical protein
MMYDAAAQCQQKLGHRADRLGGIETFIVMKIAQTPVLCTQFVGREW